MKTMQTCLSCTVPTPEQEQDIAEEGNPPQGASVCASAPALQKSTGLGNNFKSYFGGIFSLCLICCAAPYILVTLGVLSVSTGAYVGRIVETLVGFGAISVLAYFSLRYFKSR